MRDPKRIKRILNLIEEIWTANPDLRLIQLIWNCFSISTLYYIEDEVVEDRLKKCYFPLPQNSKKEKEKEETPEEFKERFEGYFGKKVEEEKGYPFSWCGYNNSAVGIKFHELKKEYCKQFESCSKCPCYNHYKEPPITTKDICIHQWIIYETVIEYITGVGARENACITSKIKCANCGEIKEI